MIMIDNLDCGIIITLDFDKDENKYMTFNLIKMRDKTNRMYIAQPFSPYSSIRLVEDMGGIPQFKESIHAAPELKRNTIIKMSGASAINEMGNVINVEEEDIKDNVFMNGSTQSYNLQPSKFGDTPAFCPITFPECPIEFINDKSSSIANQISELKRMAS